MSGVFRHVWFRPPLPVFIPSNATPPPQYGRPTSDVSVGAWQPNPSTPTTLYDKIDEAAADDADYIYATASGAVCEVALSSLSTPQAGTRTVRWRSPAGYSPNGGIQVSLVEGTTVLESWTTASVAPDTTYQHTVTAAVTNYSNLRLRFTSQ